MCCAYILLEITHKIPSRKIPETLLMVHSALVNHLTGCEHSPCWKGLNLISKTGVWLPALLFFVFFFQSHLLLWPISEHANSQARWNFPSTSSLWNIITVIILNSERSAQPRSACSANVLTQLQQILKTATMRFGNDSGKWQVAIFGVRKQTTKCLINVFCFPECCTDAFSREMVEGKMK